MPTPPAAYRFYVDWNNDADYGDTGEEVTSRVYATERIYSVRGRDQIRQLAPPMAGSSAYTLDNTSKDYSPENGSSPIAGNLRPGRRNKCVAAYGGSDYPVFMTLVEDLPQHPAFSVKTVDVPGIGTLSRLRGTGSGSRVSTALYANILTSTAIGYVLDAIGWPAGERVIDTGKTTLAWWWLDDEDAFTAILDLLNSEGPGAAIYEDRQGRFVFESRHYRLVTGRSTTAQGTFSDSGAEPWRGEIDYNPGLRSIVNACAVTAITRSAKATDVVWELGASLALAAGQTRYLVATSADPFQNAIAPVGGTDYTVVSGSIASATLDRTSGARVTLAVTAGAAGATISGLQLRADPVTVDTSTTVSESVDVTASRAEFGRRDYPLRVRQEIDYNTLQDFCNAVVNYYKSPRPTITIPLVGVTDAILSQILAREISDRVAIVDAQTVINGEAHVERIEDDLDLAYGEHRQLLGCEKASANVYAVWGTAVWGSSLWAF